MQQMEQQQRRVLVAVPSTTDVVGAGGVAPRWANYVDELRRSGWVVDVWTVDAQDEGQRIPRVVHPFFPRTRCVTRRHRCGRCGSGGGSGRRKGRAASS